MTTFTAVTQVLVALIPAYAVYWVFNTYTEYGKTHSLVKDIQSFLTFLPNSSDFSGVFTKDDRFILGSFQFWMKKHDLYSKSGWDVSAAVSLWPRVQTTFMVADPRILKDIGSQRTIFTKPTSQYKVLNFYGENIVSTEGDQWRLYRKIASPAFSERNNRLVWEESIHTIMSYLEEDWMWENTVSLDNFLSPCLQFGLRVISAAGFGKRIGWSKEDLIPVGHKLSFEETFRIVSSDIFIKVIVPNWLPNVTEKIGRVRLAFDELKIYMQDIIDGARASGAARQKDDLFSNLLQANELAKDEEGRKLDDLELIGNTFMFLLAGHETSSHTLCFAFALLALYPDEQERLYEDIMSVCPEGVPTYEDMPKLTRALAVIYETLRLFPPVVGIPKQAAEDTSLTMTHVDGETKTIAVPKGTQIMFHTTAVHYNSRYWKDPQEFQPDRFLDPDWPRDAFVPFSVGARSCLGRRFSEIESIAILSIMVKHYRIKILEEQRFQYETFEQRKERVLDCQWGITLTPKKVPLQFLRRT